MKKLLVLLIFAVFFFQGCGNPKSEEFKISKTDSINIFNSIIKSSEIKAVIKNYDADTIFVIKNEFITQPLLLNFESEKKLIFINKPIGYPKYGSFNYKRLQVSFEQLKIHKDSASCFFLIKTVGLLGDLRLVKRNNVWVIINYSKNMI